MSYNITDSVSLPGFLQLKFPRCVCLGQCYDRAVVFGALEHYLLSRHESLPDRSYQRFGGESMRQTLSQSTAAMVLSRLTLEPPMLVLPANLQRAKSCCSHRGKSPGGAEVDVASWAQYLNVRVVLYARDCKWTFQPYSDGKGVTVHLYKNEKNQYCILHTKEWSGALTASRSPAVSVKETDFSESLFLWGRSEGPSKPEGFTETMECLRKLSELFNVYTFRLSSLTASDPLLQSADSLLVLENLKNKFQNDCEKIGENHLSEQIRLSSSVSCHYCTLKTGTKVFDYCNHLLCEQCKALANKKYGSCPKCSSLPFDPHEVLPDSQYRSCSHCSVLSDNLVECYPKKHPLCPLCAKFAGFWGFCIPCLDEYKGICDNCGESTYTLKQCNQDWICLNCTRPRIRGGTCIYCRQPAAESLLRLIKRFERYPNANNGLLKEFQPPSPPADSFPCAGCGEFLSPLDYAGYSPSTVQCPICDTKNTR